MSAVPKLKGSLESCEPSSQLPHSQGLALALVISENALVGTLNANPVQPAPPVLVPPLSKQWSDDDLLTANEAAEYLRYKVKTIYNLQCSGRLRGIKRGGGKRGGLLFKKRDLDTFLYGKGGK